MWAFARKEGHEARLGDDPNTDCENRRKEVRKSVMNHEATYWALSNDM